VIGLGNDEYFVGVGRACNPESYARQSSFLADGDMAVVTPDGVHLSDF